MPITTKVISPIPAYGKAYLIQLVFPNWKSILHILIKREPMFTRFSTNVIS